MNMWADAADELYAAMQEAGEHNLTVDQRLKVAQIKALLSIGQELSLMQDQGINPKWSARNF
jgi:hypothetical protein